MFSSPGNVSGAHFSLSTLIILFFWTPSVSISVILLFINSYLFSSSYLSKSEIIFLIIKFGYYWNFGKCMHYNEENKSFLNNIYTWKIFWKKYIPSLKTIEFCFPQWSGILVSSLTSLSSQPGWFPMSTVLCLAGLDRLLHTEAQLPELDRLSLNPASTTL